MVTALVLVVTILFMNGGALGIEAMAHTMGYENRLFDNTKVHTIDIVMDDWDEFIANATSEEYYVAAVVVDGETYRNVAIRGKGNTSLSTVSSMNSERYSFKIEFDHFDDSVTYHGLDKLSLNNLIQDTTMMKDYLTYTMMNEFGAAAPLCSFVYITVNGEDWGLYLAVEGVEDSFLERNYGSDYGELYKPDSMSFGGGRGNGKDFNMNDFMNREKSSGDSNGAEQGEQMPDMGNFDPSALFGGNMPNMGELPDGFDPSQMQGGFTGEMPNMGDLPEGFDFSQMPGRTEGDSENSGTSSDSDRNSFGGFDFGAMGGFGMGASDVKLQYVNDNISSYSNIWNNAKTDITTADQYRLMESLRKLSNDEEIESVVDVEQVIRYFVIHNYVCNGDSYTGSMIHNYYLYEEDGQLAILPWDYNLAYGTFQGGNGQSTVNTPIDAPVSGGSSEDRPMWSWILSDETYTELYHQYFTEFLNTVDVRAIIDNAYNLIKAYVEKDPTAFYTYEEFETGVETLRQFCDLRSESISLQLANDETTSNMSYVDASELTLSDMGSMGGGFGGSRPGNKEDSESSADQMPNRGELPEGFDPSQMQGGFNGEMPEGFDPSQMTGVFGGAFPGQSSEGTETTEKSTRPSWDDVQIPGDFNANFMGTGSSVNADWIWVTFSVLLLGVGILIVKQYKR